MRLIDADAVMEAITSNHYPLRGVMGSIENGMFTVGIQQAVDEQPTIDAVSVVRCLECKWHYIGGTGLHWCERLCSHRPQQGPVIPTRIYGFCSYGEKREEDQP